MIAIVEYGMGNAVSVGDALDRLGAEWCLTADPADFARATHIILPGVGAFPDGMRELRDRGLISILEEEVLKNKKPFLGICLGMQLLAERGDEGEGAMGLGWIGGTVRRFRVDETAFRLPHVGWNDVSLEVGHPLFADIASPIFYFVHSFHLELTDPSIGIGKGDYGESFVAAIGKGNIYGTQFHPEKSQASGMQLLKNFIQISHA